MQTHQEIELLREVEAIQIPSGDLVTLPLGTKVMITQSLGGTYTVATPNGLARIKSETPNDTGFAKIARQPIGTTMNSDLHLHPALGTWFQETFSKPTKAQSGCVPRILKGETGALEGDSLKVVRIGAVNRDIDPQRLVREIRLHAQFKGFRGLRIEYNI